MSTAEEWAKVPVELVKAGALVPATGATATTLALNVFESARQTFPSDVMYGPLRIGGIILLVAGVWAIVHFIWTKTAARN